MATRTIHARVRGPRLLELLEDISLPEGTDVVLTIDVAEKTSATEDAPGAKPVVTFDTHDLGTFLPLTRSEIYDDAPTPLKLGSYRLGAPANLTRKDYYDDDDDQ